MKVIIHVHQQRIRQGKAAISVKTYRGTRYTRRYRIGLDAVIHQPVKPLACGAKVWIEITKRGSKC
jgi:hypothetical protein